MRANGQVRQQRLGAGIRQRRQEICRRGGDERRAIQIASHRWRDDGGRRNAVGVPARLPDVVRTAAHPRRAPPGARTPRRLRRRCRASTIGRARPAAAVADDCGDDESPPSYSRAAARSDGDTTRIVRAGCGICRVRASQLLAPTRLLRNVAWRARQRDVAGRRIDALHRRRTGCLPTGLRARSLRESPARAASPPASAAPAARTAGAGEQNSQLQLELSTEL